MGRVRRLKDGETEGGRITEEGIDKLKFLFVF
jgi:hypothetical protein